MLSTKITALLIYLFSIAFYAAMLNSKLYIDIELNIYACHVFILLQTISFFCSLLINKINKILGFCLVIYGICALLAGYICFNFLEDYFNSVFLLFGLLIGGMFFILGLFVCLKKPRKINRRKREKKGKKGIDK